MVFFLGGGGGGGGGISLKKKSGIFVSFPFSALKSEMQLTLSILFYVTVGVAENWFLHQKSAPTFDKLK